VAGLQMARGLLGHTSSNGSTPKAPAVAPAPVPADEPPAQPA
jgi:hypothetical protein